MSWKSTDGRETGLTPSKGHRVQQADRAVRTQNKSRFQQMLRVVNSGGTREACLLSLAPPPILQNRLYVDTIEQLRSVLSGARPPASGSATPPWCHRGTAPERTLGPFVSRHAHLSTGVQGSLSLGKGLAMVPGPYHGTEKYYFSPLTLSGGNGDSPLKIMLSSHLPTL